MHLISNDYLVVVLVADDRSQSRDVAQKSQDDDDAETLTLPRRRPHRPPPRCFGAGLLLHNRERERERDEEKFCVVEITQLLLDLSLSY